MAFTLIIGKVLDRDDSECVLENLTQNTVLVPGKKIILPMSLPYRINEVPKKKENFDYYKIHLPPEIKATLTPEDSDKKRRYEFENTKHMLDYSIAKLDVFDCVIVDVYMTFNQIYYARYPKKVDSNNIESVVQLCPELDGCNIEGFRQILFHYEEDMEEELKNIRDDVLTQFNF